jgi:hypothetical protein
MREAKARILLIGSLLAGQVQTANGFVPSAFVREIGFLQFRMLCEGVALACLVAHGDIQEAQSPKIQKLWEASKIMEELDKLHPDFYPHATHLKSSVAVDGSPALTIDRSKKGGLSKKSGWTAMEEAAAISIGAV